MSSSLRTSGNRNLLDEPNGSQPRGQQDGNSRLDVADSLLMLHSSDIGALDSDVQRANRTTC